MIAIAIIAAISRQSPPRYGVEFGNPCKMRWLLVALYNAGIPFEFDGRNIWVDQRNRPQFQQITESTPDCATDGISPDFN